jgi:glycosyltransferase involved in cell wall biosynthesis
LHKVLNEPLVSICIPVYNSGPFIVDCLRSLKQQTYLNWSSIIVDDASTDDSVDKIAENIEGDNRFVLYTNSRNLGMVRNWNKAISYATGNYVSILHGDDFFRSDFIAKTVECFQEHPDAGMVFSPTFDIDNKEKVNVFRPFPGDCSFNADSFVRQISEKGNFVRFPSVMLKRIVFEKVGHFDDRLVLAVDLEMWLRVSIFFQIWFLNEPLSYYRIHSSNVSRKFITVKSEIPELEFAINIFIGRINTVFDDNHAKLLENQLKNMFDNFVMDKNRLHFVLQNGGKSGICCLLHDYFDYQHRYRRKMPVFIFLALKFAYWCFYVIPFSDIIALGIANLLRLLRSKKHSLFEAWSV